jgi:hypothetical protein
VPAADVDGAVLDHVQKLLAAPELVARTWAAARRGGEDDITEPILRIPGTGREPELNERQLHARRRVHEAMAALGGIGSPAGTCVWHVVGLQRSVREWAIRQGWGGRSVRQEQAQGILVAALGMLAGHLGYGAAKRDS